MIRLVALVLLGGCQFRHGVLPSDASGQGDTLASDDAMPSDSLTTTADAAFACPGGYTLRVPRSCHRVVSSLVTWQVAEMDCETAGAHLVVVDDATEDTAVPDNVWIGYTEIVTPGTFRWVTGVAGTYTGWAALEPGSIGGASCVEARLDGWHDDNCPELKSYVCEYDGRAADPAQF